jgi:RND superfamily putative drug exporter
VFSAIGRFDVRYRYLILIVWLIAVPAAVKLLPTLSSVIRSDSSQFLSASTPSVKAANLAASFEGKNPGATAVLVAVRDSGPLTSADAAAISRLEKDVTGISGVSLVRDLGDSNDGKAREVVMATSGSAMSLQARTIVTTVRTDFGTARPPAGLTFHLTGELAEGVDATSSGKSGSIAAFSLLFIILLLFMVYRAAVAPLLTLIPAGVSLAIAGPLVALSSKAGVSISDLTQELLTVLLLGAGTDYGLFLVFRVREERARGASPDEAVVSALGRVGETISYSGLTVAAALLTLLLASFGIFRGLGPALAIGLTVMLAASLTLTPALLSIFGKVLFWPYRPEARPPTAGAWGRLAGRLAGRPALTLVGGLVIIAALAAGLTGYRTAGFSNGAPAGTDSAAGVSVLEAHFSAATAGSDDLLLQFSSSVWDNLGVVVKAERELNAAPVFRSVSGPLHHNGAVLTTTELHSLGYTLGPPILLPQAQDPANPHVAPALYTAYRAVSQYISVDGKTVQFYATLDAGPPGTTAAAGATPAANVAVAAVARDVGATAYGVTGQDPVTYDINRAASTSLVKVVPAVLLVILLILALLLRSLVAPWYLVLTGVLSFLASLGVAMIAFVHLGGGSGLSFVLPFLLFVFSMALGEDYNILVMSRIREEVGRWPTLREAIAHAIGITSGTVTSAGIILAGTFTVLGVVGGNGQAQQIGFGIAFAVFLDSFLIRALLIPSIVALFGRWNWWPSALSAAPAAGLPARVPEGAGLPAGVTRPAPADLAAAQAVTLDGMPAGATGGPSAK